MLLPDVICRDGLCQLGLSLENDKSGDIQGTLGIYYYILPHWHLILIYELPLINDKPLCRTSPPQHPAFDPRRTIPISGWTSWLGHIRTLSHGTRHTGHMACLGEVNLLIHSTSSRRPTHRLQSTLDIWQGQGQNQQATGTEECNLLSNLQEVTHFLRHIVLAA